MLNSCIMNPKVGPLGSHSCYCCDALWAPRHQTSKVCTQPSVASFAVFFPLQHHICILEVTTEQCRNLTTRLRIVPLCSTIQLSSLSGWPRRSTDEGTMQVDLVPLAVNFASRVGPCAGMFKHFLCVTNHLPSICGA